MRGGIRIYGGDLEEVVDEGFLIKVDAKVIVLVLYPLELYTEEMGDGAHVLNRSHSFGEFFFEVSFNPIAFREVTYVIYVDADVYRWLARNRGTVK